VAFVIEVKSDLEAQWAQVKSTTSKVRPLVRKWRGHTAINPTGELSVMSASHSRIPVIAVGYEGFNSAESLCTKLLGTPEEERPDCSFVIKSGHYVSWNGRMTTREEGFFQFCADCSYFMRNVLTAEPDLIAYIGGDFL
jgi:hypothetical protein